MTRRGERAQVGWLHSGALCGLLGALALSPLVGCSSSSSSTPTPPPAPTPTAQAVALVARMSQADELVLIKGQNKASTDTKLSAGYVPAISGTDSSGTAYSIPAQYLCDSPNGVGNSNTGVTRFPTGVNVASTWNVDLAKSYGDAAGNEWHGKGCTTALGPAMNIDRLLYNGRNGEYMGEDPFLAGKIASNVVKGIQAEKVVATIKHYALNNQETERSGGNSVVAERAMREIYLPAFEACVKEGDAGAVMCSYNRINGTYACENPHTLTDVLRTDWGFDGFVMSDWGATHSDVAAATAGEDQDMPGTFSSYFGNLAAAITSGTFTKAGLDKMATHILAAYYKVGLMDAANQPPATPVAVVSTDAHKDLAQQISEESTVLLQNKGGVLPLAATTVKVAVIGPGASATVMSTIGGSGSVNADTSGTDGGIVTPLQGIQDKFGASNVTYGQGSYGSQSLPILDGTASTGNANLASPGFTSTFYDAGGNEISGDAILGETLNFGSCFFGSCSVTTWPGSLASDTTGWTMESAASMTVATAGTYTFQLTGAGTTKLYVDGALATSITEASSNTTETFTVSLTAAAHTLYVTMDTSSYGWPMGWFSVTPPSLSLAWSPTDLAGAAVALARAADVAVIFLEDSESEGSDHTAYLPGDQNALVTKVAAVAKKTVVVLNTGSPLVLPWADKVDAILENWYGGQRLGRAIANVLAGDVNPSGKLVATFPAAEAQLYARDATEYPGTKVNGNSYSDVMYDEGIFVGYRWFDQKQLTPLFPFGHGLSYTTFGYSGLGISPSSGDGSAVTVTVKVANTGARAGQEVAQLYVGFPEWTGEPPRQLKGFQKLSLDKGASGTASFALDSRAFSYWNESTGGWLVAPGEYQIYVGSSSRDIRAAGTFTVN